MRYGSRVRRQGRSRPFRRYHLSSVRRNRCRAGGEGRRAFRVSSFEFRVARRFNAKASSPKPQAVQSSSPAIIRIVKIYTKTGDSGETDLFDGTRVAKSTDRVGAYGGVDELNAVIGAVRALGVDGALDEMLARIQRDLFALGARLADPARRIAGRVTKAALGPEDVTRLEGWIDELEAGLPQLRRFILPGGAPAGASLHLARTICRRAERHIVALGPDAIEPPMLAYVNRLSDLLFVMARAANHRAGVPEQEW